MTCVKSPIPSLLAVGLSETSGLRFVPEMKVEPHQPHQLMSSLRLGGQQVSINACARPWAGSASREDQGRQAVSEPGSWGAALQNVGQSRPEGSVKIQQRGISPESSCVLLCRRQACVGKGRDTVSPDSSNSSAITVALHRPEPPFPHPFSPSSKAQLFPECLPCAGTSVTKAKPVPRAAGPGVSPCDAVLRGLAQSRGSNNGTCCFAGGAT